MVLSDNGDDKESKQKVRQPQVPAKTNRICGTIRVPSSIPQGKEIVSDIRQVPNSLTQGCILLHTSIFLSILNDFFQDL